MSNCNNISSLYQINRRQLLGMPFALAIAGRAKAADKPRVATIVTEYRDRSHADVIVGRLLEGYEYYGTFRKPRVNVVSMYIDQVPDNDMSYDLAAKHGFKIFPSVREALLMGGKNLAVDGVVLIGEHGSYHSNIKGQKLYPRWYLYKQIIDAFRRAGSVAPVYVDKHFSVDWDEAKWMYEQSREMNFPFMGGSSLPLAWRIPELELELETPVEKAVAVSFGGKEAYGFHGLETLQCMVERRRGGETGVAGVRCLDGDEVWKWTDANPWADRLMKQCLLRCTESKKSSPRVNVKAPAVFVIDYRNGLQAAMYVLNGQGLDSWAFAAEIRGKKEPVSTQFRLQRYTPHNHFSPLVNYIEEMILTGRTSYPVERTLLTTGTLAALIDSSFYKRRIETPHLDIVYRAQKESLYNRGPVPAPKANG